MPVKVAGHPGGIRERSSRAERSASRYVALAATVLVLAGCGLRVAAWVWNKSLWWDELSLVREVMPAGYRGLLHPLKEQVAPVGFLLLARLSIDMFGSGERALRFVPMLSAVASVPLTWLVIRRLVRGWPALVGLAVFALAPFLIYYAAEFKQYSTEAVITTLLLLAIDYWFHHRDQASGWLILLGAGMIGLICSLPSAFLIAGFGLTAFIWCMAGERRRDLPRLVLVGFAWAAVGFVQWYFILSHSAASPSLRAYWREGFMPRPPWSAAALLWWPSAFNRLCIVVLGLHPAPIWITALLLMAGGAICLYRKGGLPGRVLLAGLGVQLLAAGVGAYPFSHRLLVFSAPCWAVLISAGCAALARIGGRWGHLLAGVAATVVVGRLAWSAPSAYRPYLHIDSRTAVEHIAQQAEPGDTVWVYYGLNSAYQYYAPRFGLSGLEVVYGPGDLSGDAGLHRLEQSLDELPRGRVWVVTGMDWIYGRDDGQTIVHRLDRRGRAIEAVRVDGVSILLYDLTVAPSESKANDGRGLSSGSATQPQFFMSRRWGLAGDGREKGGHTATASDVVGYQSFCLDRRSCLQLRPFSRRDAAKRAGSNDGGLGVYRR